MSRSSLLRSLLLGSFFLLPSIPASAQATPIGDEFPICPGVARCSENYSCSITHVRALPTGLFSVGLWQSYQQGDDEWCGNHVRSTWVSLLDEAGTIAGGCGGAGGSRESDRYPDEAYPSGNARGAVVVVWSELDYDTTYVWLDRCGPGWGIGDPILIDSPVSASSPSAAINALGQTVLAWTGCDSCPVSYLPNGVWVQALGIAMRPATPVLRLLLKPDSGYVGQPAIAIDPVGRFTVVWPESRTRWDVSEVVRGQPFGRDGRILGPTFEIDEASFPAAYLLREDGSLAIVWRTQVPSSGENILWLRTYDSAGRPLSPRVVVTRRASLETSPWIAADRRGNLGVLWQESAQGLSRLFNRELVAQGGAFAVGPPGTGAEGIALSDTGGLFTTHGTLVPGPYHSASYPIARFWHARHEEDACVVRDGVFSCDTANDGGEGELRIVFSGGLSTPVPLLGDWDGDGRADPCVYGKGRFLCDTSHEGNAGSVSSSGQVGKAGDRPLLGDLNGDGRADPCVRRAADFLCDLARDGGPKDLRIVFGRPTDTPLLGDLDGDGRDDPCILRGGFLLCDAAHDGNQAELRFDLRPLAAAGPTLLGDVDGDRRDDACRYTGSKFICGIFPPRGGAPTGTIELNYGRPGDVPLLGDLDAF